jgi:hypothetical protein
MTNQVELTFYVFSMQGKKLHEKRRIVGRSLKKNEFNRNKITQLFHTPNFTYSSSGTQASIIDSFASVPTETIKT